MKKRRAVLKPKRKAPAQKRKRGAPVQCWSCPREHPGWKRSQLRSRKRAFYCPEHLEEYDGKHKPWPKCPRCKNDDSFGIFRWNGGPKECTVECPECGYSAKALKHFDEITLKVIAAPVKGRTDG